MICKSTAPRGNTYSCYNIEPHLSVEENNSLFLKPTSHSRVEVIF